MKLILLIGLVINMAFITEAVGPYCWNTNTAASADLSTLTPDAGTHCTYTHEFGLYGSFRRLMWPISSTYEGSSSSNCPPSATCIVAVANSATVTAAKVEDLPPVSSCYSNKYKADNLQSQTTAACDASSRYCQSTFTGLSSDGKTAESVESGCAASCPASTSTNKVSCSLVADTNKVLGCNVGVYYQSVGTSKIEPSICAEKTAAYCQSVYQWSSTYGYTVTGSCVDSCFDEPILRTGTVSTGGKVCSSSIYGNPSSLSTRKQVNYILFVTMFAYLGLNLLF